MGVKLKTVCLCGLAISVFAVRLDSQVVYVKCCMDRTKAIYGFSRCMRGPYTYAWAVGGYSCIFGFGADRIGERMEAMCRDADELPDQSNGECTVWHDDSAKMVARCEVWMGLQWACRTLFDYDLDWDVDLRDYAAHQVYVGSGEATDHIKGTLDREETEE